MRDPFKHRPLPALLAACAFVAFCSLVMAYWNVTPETDSAMAIAESER